MLRYWRGLLRFGMVISVLSAGAVFGHPATAQSSKTVTYDTPVEGQITDAAVEDTWTLTAPSKDKIAIVVERTGGTLLPSVELRDSNNQRINSHDVDNSMALASVDQQVLPSAGTYTVAVSRYGGQDGKSTGNYKLTVKLLGAGDESPTLQGTPTAIDYTKPVEGELTNGKWKDKWTFSTPGKDVVTIAVVRSGGVLFPELDLEDASGNSLTKGYLDNTGDGSQIAHYTLPGPGQYSVVVQRQNGQDGGTTGKYSLSITLDGAAADRPELAKPQGPLALDSSVNGTLTNDKWVDVWSLDAQSKDHLLFTVTRTDGNLLPVVYLFGANNQEITRGYPDNTGAKSQIETTLPGPGKYEVRVMRSDNENGLTTGKYQLDAMVLGLGDDNPAFKTSAGEVKLDGPSKGNLTNDKWMDTWTLNLTTNDPVTISVTRTSGTLSPAIRLLNANQQDVSSAQPDQTWATATIDQYTPPGPGQYTIIVTRYSNRDGETSGGYELSVTQGKKQ